MKTEESRAQEKGDEGLSMKELLAKCSDFSQAGQMGSYAVPIRSKKKKKE